jgi:hypothetical protein
MAKDDEREAAYRREQMAESAHRSKPAAWTAFAAAAIFAGKDAGNATRIADQTLAAYDSRFVATPTGEDDDS